MASSSNSTIDIDVPSVSEVTFKTIGKCGDTFTHFEAVSKNELVEMSHNSTQASTSADSDHDTCCTFCKKTFTSEWHRNWHIKRMHNELGIFCDICNALFTTISSYKSHYDVQHPINGKSKQTVKSECLPSNTDQLIVRENDLLRMKIKTLKEKLKETEKYRSKELKSLEKKMKKRVEEQLLEKGAILTILQKKVTTLQRSNIQLLQSLQNERMKVEMINDTLMAVCGCVNVKKTRDPRLQ